MLWLKSPFSLSRFFPWHVCVEAFMRTAAAATRGTLKYFLFHTKLCNCGEILDENITFGHVLHVSMAFKKNNERGRKQVREDCKRGDVMDGMLLWFCGLRVLTWFFKKEGDGHRFWSYESECLKAEDRSTNSSNFLLRTDFKFSNFRTFNFDIFKLLILIFWTFNFELSIF